jgi:hypothetical protein
VQTNLECYKKDLSKLIALGNAMHLDLEIQAMKNRGKLDKRFEEAKQKIAGTFQREYQKWYTEPCAVIKQLLPERVVEFEAFYKADPKRKKVDATTYTIQDWLMGLRASPHVITGEKPFDDFAAVVMRFSIQLEILKSVEVRFESSLFDIRQLVQADLFDSELDAARELLKKGFLRAAGIVAGVVLEKHLQVCDNHRIVVRKQHPTIGDFNDLLKNGNVIDVPIWRLVQRLGDLRNVWP